MIYRWVIRPILFKMDAEDAHELTLALVPTVLYLPFAIWMRIKWACWTFIWDQRRIVL